MVSKICDVIYVLKIIGVFVLLWYLMDWPWWGQLLTLVLGVPVFFFIDFIIGKPEPLFCHIFSKEREEDENDNINRNFYDYM